MITYSAALCDVCHENMSGREAYLWTHDSGRKDHQGVTDGSRLITDVYHGDTHLTGAEARAYLKAYREAG